MGKNISYNDSCIEGAQKLLAESLQITKKDKIVILSTEGMTEFTKYLFKAAVKLNKKDICNIVIPEEFRPMKSVPDLLVVIAQEADGVIHITERRAEEDFTFIRPFRSMCETNQCKYLYLYDANLDYLGKGGINADYGIVNKKTIKVADLLKESSKIFVSSDYGTSLSFELYNTVVPRGPIFGKGQYTNQAPEGETMSVPIEESFEGKLIVDGPVTGVGKLKELISWEFEKGKVTKCEGNKSDLDKLFKILKSSDSNIRSLEGISIAEFALGTNDWARADENISNCEKVSGTVHFGMGKRVGGIGKDRGEKYHFDSMLMNNVSVKIKSKTGKLVELVISGKLML